MICLNLKSRRLGLFLFLGGNRMEKAWGFVQQYMKQVQGVVTREADIAWESVTLYQDELDNHMVPVEVIKSFSDPLTIMSASFADQEGNNWLFGIVIDELVWRYAFCLKNDQLVDRNIPIPK
ncbi:MAG: hypothetical protein ACM3X1_04810 [Ignavibacteriales bacterium]